MTLRFRHSISVAEGVRLVKGQRVINLSDLTRAKAWSEHDQQYHAPLTMPTSGLHYITRFDSTRAHQHRAFQLRERQKWTAKAYDLSFTTDDNTQLKVNTLQPSLDAGGVLRLKAAEGVLLTDRDVNKLWDELPQLLRSLLEEQALLINGPIADYADVHLEAPKLPEGLPIYSPSEFAEPQPQRPDPLSLPPEPVYPQPPSIKLWHRLIPGRQQQLSRAHQNALHEWQTAKLRWKAETHQAKSTSDRARQRYKAYLSVWKARKLAHEAEQQVYAEQFSTLLLNDENLMTEVLIAELTQLDWPRQTHISFQLDLNHRTAWLDLELPTLDDISPLKAEISLQTHSVKMRQKTDEQVSKEYSRSVHASVVRVIGVVLSSLPAMDRVVVSGYTQRKDLDTGFDRDDYLISVRVDRNDYAALDMDSIDEIDPKSILQRFNVMESLNSGLFSSIQPFEPESD
ncbi:hypothetical protein [Nitrincola schmidtii]|uniref:hypothetical protein n=1 Tax=Nitrincola schmidtii TaxID=1730894 RepID=UPI00124EB683|nr:hypothetical protein [Nitrincola schmidtii]